MDWILECSSCSATRSPEGLQSVCSCGRPWLVRYPNRQITEGGRNRLEGRGMWRYRAWLPLVEGEVPVSLGEGETPLLGLEKTGRRLGLNYLLIKDEASNPTGSFKARGLSAAVTRAVNQGATSFVIPTAGNAGVAAAAYCSRAGVPVRVFAPTSTPPAATPRRPRRSRQRQTASPATRLTRGARTIDGGTAWPARLRGSLQLTHASL